jgi:ribosomal 50S subunit-associated protein YjgA (DUF615 family)
MEHRIAALTSALSALEAERDRLLQYGNSADAYIAALKAENARMRELIEKAKRDGLWVLDEAALSGLEGG